MSRSRGSGALRAAAGRGPPGPRRAAAGREARLAQLLAPFGRDPVGRPGVVQHDVDLRLAAERDHRLLHLPPHRVERRAAQEGGRELDPNARRVDRDRLDHAEVDERDDGDLRIRDLRQRLPDALGRHHCAPTGAERRTIVISSQSAANSRPVLALDRLDLVTVDPFGERGAQVGVEHT